MYISCHPAESKTSLLGLMRNMALEMLSRQSLRRLEEDLEYAEQWPWRSWNSFDCLHSEIRSLGPSVCQGWTDLHWLLSNRFPVLKSKHSFLKPSTRLGQNILPPICCRGWSWRNSLLWGQNSARGQRSRDIRGFAHSRVHSSFRFLLCNLCIKKSLVQIGHTVTGPEDTVQQLKQLLGINWATGLQLDC